MFIIHVLRLREWLCGSIRIKLVILPRCSTTSFTFPPTLPTIFFAHLCFLDPYHWVAFHSQILNPSIQLYKILSWYRTNLSHPLLIYKWLLKWNVGNITYMISGIKTVRGLMWLFLGGFLSNSDRTAYNCL